MRLQLDCVISAMDETLLTDHISFSARAFSTKCTFLRLVSGVSKVPVSSFTFNEKPEQRRHLAAHVNEVHVLDVYDIVMCVVSWQ